ncbi:MAG: DUF3297 family protein [Phycisphaerales bacterium]|nr:DUF3297 family protein [Phycisphaerales bacterium]
MNLDAISVDKKSPHYSPCAHGDIEVIFDGVRRNDVVTAHAKEGWIEVFRRDLNNKIIDGPTGPLVDRIHGKVELRGAA